MDIRGHLVNKYIYKAIKMLMELKKKLKYYISKVSLCLSDSLNYLDVHYNTRLNTRVAISTDYKSQQITVQAFVSFYSVVSVAH